MIAFSQGGVVLGADTRATGGDTVCDKNCDKIHYIADNIWCCGAGTSADTEASTALVSSQLELHRMATNKAPRVMTALTMLKRMLFRYQGQPHSLTTSPKPAVVLSWRERWPTACEPPACDRFTKGDRIHVCSPPSNQGT